MSSSEDKIPANHGNVCPVTDSRTGRTVAEIKQSFLDSLFCGLGRVLQAATTNDLYTALALTVRDRLLKQGVLTLEHYARRDPRVVCYFSAEYLPGPHLAVNLLNLGITEQTREALKELDIDLNQLEEQEEEPGLGNGGLGRLASCYLDSMASLEIPAIGFGIRYEFGIFDQVIRDGWQIEITDKWLRFGNPWETPRPEIAHDVMFGGHTEPWTDENGHYRVRWVPETLVKGVAYDTPIIGYDVCTCDLKRLWKAEATESFDFEAFNHGDYYRAVEDKMFSENITKVLYPNDEVAQGKTLRLKQQFFFVTCSLQDLIRVHLRYGRSLERFHEKFAIQLNDTHPAIAVAELMRLLLDVQLFDWETAWHVTANTFAYTNHTLLPEALEKWAVSLMGRVLPRHLEIINEINRRFLDEVRARFPGDEARVTRMSIIEEAGSERYVRMAYLATVGSHRVNGVAALHSELLRNSLLKDFAEMWPAKFCNITNGVSQRRFLAVSNPPLAALITDHIGDAWLHDLYELRRLEPLLDNESFCSQWRAAKLLAKQELAALIEERVGVKVNPKSLFDIQAKRIHEYKRQHLNVLHILTLYLQLKRNPDAQISPRTFVFAGKAAPGYYMAKLIIKLINSVAEVVNADPDIHDGLKVAFYPDFNVQQAQHIYPAADLSEQLSTAGKEASGTGNMKFSLNGALTIGTLDGANIEIREEVGADNFFMFGMSVTQVDALRHSGYRPRDYYETNPALREVIDFIGSGALAGGNRDLFRPLVDNLLNSDPFMVLADYQSYLDCQEQVSALWQDQAAWTRKSILSAARMGKFSSDRSIRDYCDLVWNIRPSPVCKACR